MVKYEKGKTNTETGEFQNVLCGAFRNTHMMGVEFGKIEGSNERLPWEERVRILRPSARTATDWE